MKEYDGFLESPNSYRLFVIRCCYLINFTEFFPYLYYRIFSLSIRVKMAFRRTNFMISNAHDMMFIDRGRNLVFHLLHTNKYTLITLLTLISPFGSLNQVSQSRLFHKLGLARRTDSSTNVLILELKERSYFALIQGRKQK